MYVSSTPPKSVAADSVTPETAFVCNTSLFAAVPGVSAIIVIILSVALAAYPETPSIALAKLVAVVSLSVAALKSTPSVSVVAPIVTVLPEPRPV